MPKRSLLFLITDEQRTDTFAGYGNTRIETPNLNRLARQSVVFDRCYVTQPVCTPSRSTLLTGLYPHTSGCTSNNIPLPETTRCLPERASGYRTAYFGKWHLGDEIFAQHGFQHWVSVEDGYRQHYRPDRDPNARSSYHEWLVKHGFKPDTAANTFSRDAAAKLPEAYSKPAFLAESVSSWLGDLDVNGPFIAFVSFLEPHMPFTGPRDAQYDPAQLPVPPNFLHELDPSYHLKARIMRQTFRRQGFGGMPLDSDAQWRQLMARYWGLVSEVDTAVGSILNLLHYRGLDEHTIVVFTSDHGEMMGSHGLLTKTLMFEESSRVPLLVRVPGHDARHVAHAVSHIDLVPTLLDLMGAGEHSGLPGGSLMPLIRGHRMRRPTDVVVQWNGKEGEWVKDSAVPDYLAALAPADQLRAAMSDPIRTLVTPDGWKLNYSPRLGQHELFNLNADPYEMRNAYSDPANRRTLDGLRRRLAAWGARVGDPIAAGIA